jgi:hypothetical protein
MLKPIHRQITIAALEDLFSQNALEVIVTANLGQDALRRQVGHDEFHFDNNAFDKACAYIETQRNMIVPALGHADPVSAWQAFGRLTHTAQDFYAHSNYIALWMSGYAQPALPAPEQIDPLDPELIHSPRLQSGKLYYPLEALSFIPGLKRLVLPWLPHDSHAWMNLDEPSRGRAFPYAFQAAVKRTRHEYDLVSFQLMPEMRALFLG